jgi:hypothetical protein
MPSDAEVTIRAESVRAMTGFTEPAFEALLLPLSRPLWPTCKTIRLRGSLTWSAATVRMTRVPDPR